MATRQQKTNPKKAVTVEKRPRGVALALGLALVAAAIAAHFPAIRAGYAWDDKLSLYENPLVTGPDGLFKLWFTTEALDYWPLTSTTFRLEWRIWGNRPAPYHAANIALHGLAAVVLWRVLKRLGLGNLGAFLSALLFAVHPVTVESVAWISERKNVLSMLLYLLSILAYLRFEDQGRKRWYLFALMAAAAALLAKTSVVALPIILLVLTWWRHNRITRQAVVHTAPFFLISVVLGLVTIWFQHHNAIGTSVVRPEGLASRIASVGWTFWFYLYKIVVPIDLAMIYPRWDIDGGQVFSFIPLVLLVACFLVLWYYRKGWGKGPLVALGSFAIVLAPVLGLINMSYSKHSLVADHLQYPGMPGLMALIGGCLAAAWSRAGQSNNRGAITGIASLGGAIILTLVVLTWRQACVYRDEETLWSHTIQLNDRAWMAYYNRGNAYHLKADYRDAIQDYTKAIALKPDYERPYNNRGGAYLKLNEPALAVQDFTKALELKPALLTAMFNRGNAYVALGKLDLAIKDLTRFIEMKPDIAQGYNDRGTAYIQIGDHARAIQDFTKAIELDPRLASAYLERGNSHAALGQSDLAISDYTRFIEMKPNFAVAYNNRGAAYGSKNDYERAVQDHSKAIELDPAWADAYVNRAVDLYFLGRYDQAWADVIRCQQLGGKLNPGFMANLAKASGRTE